MLNLIKETDSAFNNECLQQSKLMTHTCTKRVTSSTDIALSYHSWHNNSVHVLYMSFVVTYYIFHVFESTIEQNSTHETLNSSVRVPTLIINTYFCCNHNYLYCLVYSFKCCSMKIISIERGFLWVFSHLFK